MSCGAGAKYPGSEFDKLFASRFNELDSLISSDSSPDFPAAPAPVFAKKSSCRPCGALEMPSEGKGQTVLQWIAFFLLVVGIALLLMYIFQKLRKTRKGGNLFGSMVLPSVGQKSAGGTVATPPRDTTGQAKTPLGEGKTVGSVKVIMDPSKIVPSSDAKIQINMFFAEWCGHCKTLKPQFVELADSHPDVDFALVENTVMQQHPQADSFGVRGFPHVAAFLGKKQLGTLVGNQGKDKLNEFINKMKAMKGR
jgi:thiol-disulfide isomerase/thioredoxin